jgi:hypothetical protein
MLERQHVDDRLTVQRKPVGQVTAMTPGAPDAIESGVDERKLLLRGRIGGGRKDDIERRTWDVAKPLSTAESFTKLVKATRLRRAASSTTRPARDEQPTQALAAAPCPV